MLGRGRGGVQVLERLGLESAENLYSPVSPRQCRGIQIMCCLCMVWKATCIRCFFGEAISRVGGAGPEYRFGPESAENLYSPACPRSCRGIQNMWRGRFGSRGGS